MFGFGERRVVNNRVFLLGLDDLYRGTIKIHESGELLGCARLVAEALHATPAEVPVEGYYAEDERLTEYFRLLRALQCIDDTATRTVESLPEFRRLRDVASSPLYGSHQYNGKLLPAGRDALSRALARSTDWTLKTLTAAAQTASRETDDISLVGLAARIQDAVVLTALRESVVLYAEEILRSARLSPRQRPKYLWKVDEELARHARTFIDTFNDLFGEELPPPDPSQAGVYWAACHRNRILGRCVRLGSDDGVSPVRHYHWAICRDRRGDYVVQEFWESEVWTTTRYEAALLGAGRCPDTLG